MSIPRECNQRGPSYRHEHAEPRTRYPVTMLVFFAPVRGPRIPVVALDHRERVACLQQSLSAGRMTVVIQRHSGPRHGAGPSIRHKTLASTGQAGSDAMKKLCPSAT